MMPLAFLVLATTDYGLWMTALMGISFSVIPAVIWLSTAMLVDKARVGTAFGLINMIQSLGMATANYGAGYLNEAFKAGQANPAGYDAMLAMFAGLGTIAFISSVLLLIRERRQCDGGIEARLIGHARQHPGHH